MPATLTLRLATGADIGAVDALLARSYPRLLKSDYPPSIMVTAVPLIARAKPSLVGSGRYYVAELPGEGIVGAGGWSVASRAAGSGEIRHLVTDPRLTRQGVARRIVTAALGAAKSEGLHRMGCLATRTAVPFYEAMGFRLIGPVEIGLAPGISFPALQMTRAI